LLNQDRKYDLQQDFTMPINDNMQKSQLKENFGLEQLKRL